MRRSVTSFVGSVAVVCLGTIVLAQQVSVDFDRAANFAKFKAFAWTAGTPVADDLNHQRIVRAIEDQLMGRGMAKVDQQAGPDVLVAYHASFDRDLQITGFGSGPGPFYRGGRPVSARAQQVVVGTLVVDIVDAATRAMLWRGIAASDLNPAASAEKRDKNVTRAVTKLFRNYPPKTATR
jgi:hypothetical protein